MARFRSFDMTGMTKFNSYNMRSPSQITHNQVDSAMGDAQMNQGLVPTTAAAAVVGN